LRGLAMPAIILKLIVNLSLFEEKNSDCCLLRKGNYRSIVIAESDFVVAHECA
jgi:hypothetical protein